MKRNYEVLGFTSQQWEKSIWLSALGDMTGGFWIYARRKGERYKKLWAGMTDDCRKLAIIQPIKMSLDEWDKTDNIKRKEMLKDLEEKYWKKYHQWEVLE